MAQTNTKSIKTSANRTTLNEKEREEKIKKAQENIKEGSLASKANMVIFLNQIFNRHLRKFFINRDLLYRTDDRAYDPIYADTCRFIILSLMSHI